jgi:Fungal specific transcription factor domain
VEDDVDLTDTNTSFALPSKSSAEKLVQSFFNTWHPLFPVLHRPSFQWDFEAMYTEKASKDPAHFAQMWLVLAIAARDAAAKVCHLEPFEANNRALRQLLTTQNSSSAHDISFVNYSGDLQSMA